MGFFKDELFFRAASERSPVLAALAVLAAALTFAYLGRFWLGVFAGRSRGGVRRLPALLVAPIVVLAAISLAGGIVLEPFAHLAEAAAAGADGAAAHMDAGYHLDLRSENVMALSAWVLGTLVLVVPSVRDPIAWAVGRAGDRLGPRHWYATVLHALNLVSDWAHRVEVRGLRTSLAAVLVPTGVLGALGFAATPSDGAYVVGPIALSDLPIVALLGLAVVAASTAVRDSGRLRPVLALSVLGFSLAAVYAVMGAPDVALVATVIETVLTLVFVGVFSRLPGTMVGDGRGARVEPHRPRKAAAGIVAGVSAFAVIWAALSRPPLGSSDAAEQIARTPAAHGGDVVTVILADFRGLDTMVEITVLAVAVIAVASLLRREGEA
jgi:multicomponent Na+:H+ antiporter subunit A